MKKIMMSLALLSASAFTVFAQTPANPQCCEKNAAECTLPLECAGGNGRECKVFEGLNLTAEQKSKLSSLQAGRISKDAKGGKCNREKDGKREKLSPEQMKKNHADRVAKQKESRKAYLVQVKEILSPEQYVMFLENSYTMQGDRRDGHKVMRHENRKIDKKRMHKMKDPSAAKINKDKKD